MQLPEDLIEIIRQKPRTVALTGAGISAESGLPTFREAQTGLWARYRPEDLATPEAFRRDPDLVWKWYAWRRSLVWQAEPNPGHTALARLQTLLPEFRLVTQNVDGLHQRAGSREVLELHGNILRARCTDQDHPVEIGDEDGETAPRCPVCGSLLRPDVVWFGEALPPGTLEAAYAAALECQLFISIGTSGQVEPAASLAFAALDAGAQVLEINPQPTRLTPSATWVLPVSAAAALPALARTLEGQGN